MGPSRYLLGLLAVLACACGGTTVLPECDVPGAVNLTVFTTERLNPDPRGRALPTVLRLYHLTDLAEAETATFEELWNESEEVLGEAVVGTDELTVYPDRRLERSFERNPDANYLLAMGLFRSPGGRSWRTIMDLPPPPEEQECAARAAAEDDEEAPELVNPRVELFMDDFRIEGTLILEPATSGCVGFECDIEEVGDQAEAQAEAAEEQAADAAEGAGSQALEQTPGSPGSAPDVSGPQLPQAPAPKTGLGPSRKGNARVRKGP